MLLSTMIRKEMLQSLTSLRFLLTFLLVVCLFVVSSIAFLGKYQQEIRDFSAKTNENLAGLRQQADNLSRIPNYTQTIEKRPWIAQLYSEGFEKSLPNRFRMNAFSIQPPELAGRSNFLFPRFADVDWAFMITFILSFVALLLTFDSISAEKERGTLRLCLSNPVPRDTLVLSKYLSVMGLLLIPLLMGVLLSLLIVSASGLLSSDANEWLLPLAFLGVSVLYLSLFTLLGIFVSSRSAKSSSSIVLLLFLWVTLTMIVPSLGRIAAERLVDVPSRPEVDRVISEAEREMWDHADRYGKNAGSWGGDPHADWVNPAARARLFNAISENRNQLNEAHLNKMLAQADLGRNLTCFSPTVLYQRVSEALLGIGMARVRHMYGQLQRYREVLREFVLDADSRDPESFHLMAEGRQHQILLSQKPVEPSAIPVFQEREPSLGTALKKTVWDIGALALLNLLLFMGVYLSFLRYDVR